MKTYLCIFLAVISLAFSSQGVFSPIKRIPGSLNEKFNNPFSTYNPKENNIFMAWTGTTDFYFAVYNPKTGKFSKEPTILKRTGTVNEYMAITSCYIPSNNSMFLTWIDNEKKLIYTVIDCKTYQYIKEPIKILDYSLQSDFIYCCYSPKNDTIFTSFSLGDSQKLSYGLFDCKKNDFSLIKELSDDSVDDDVYPIYNPSNNTIFLTWAANNTSLDPFYAVFDCDTGKLKQNSQQIGKNTYTAGVGPDVFSTYIEKERQVFMSWTSLDSQQVLYALYDSDSDRIVIEPTKVNIKTGDSVIGQVQPCYYPVNNTVFFCWVQGPSGTSEKNYYSVYDCKLKRISEEATSIPYTDDDVYRGLDDIQPILFDKNSAIFLTWEGIDPWSLGLFQFYRDKISGLRKVLNETNPVDYQKGYK